MKHNNAINEVIRAENDDFNATWINAHDFVGGDVVLKSELDVSEATKLDASPFMIVWLKNIERLCGMFDKSYDYKDFVLLDVGCGSGISTLFFNHKYPFKRFFGFDFSAKLIGMAENNKVIASTNDFDVSKVNFKVADAKKVRLESERNAIFMFNPFGWQTMSIFIENNAEMLKETKSVLLYANDICIEEMLDYGAVVERDDFYNLSLISFG
jgi:SAM-dependent methyltransferase